MIIGRIFSMLLLRQFFLGPIRYIVSRVCSLLLMMRVDWMLKLLGKSTTTKMEETIGTMMIGMEPCSMIMSLFLKEPLHKWFKLCTRKI